MPAEWEPHAATWIGWPHNRSDWPGRFGPIPWAYTELVRHIAAGEDVEILIQSTADQREARAMLRRAGIDGRRVRFRRFPTNRGWTRDLGPLFVLDPRRRVTVARFRFTGWAKYRDHKLDDAVPPQAARALRLPILPVRHAAGGRARDVVLEGGSIDVNGAGTLLTTEECLLHPSVQVRNRGFSRADYEEIFRTIFGVTRTIWLGRGIAGDDTHGHVDDLARFVGPRTIVIAREKNPRDANHRPLEDNWQRLRGARLADGSRPEVIALPMPAPYVFSGQRLPASYANFYICNAAVLVPTFNDPADRLALGILADLIRDRPVVGVNARDLVWGLGTLHCLTQQQPHGG